MIALAEFLKQGGYERYLRQTRVRYTRQMEHMRQLIARPCSSAKKVYCARMDSRDRALFVSTLIKREILGRYARDLEPPHMADVEKTRAVSRGEMLLKYAGLVVQRHRLSAKFDHSGTVGGMPRRERRLTSRIRFVRHRLSHPTRLLPETRIVLTAPRGV